MPMADGQGRAQVEQQPHVAVITHRYPACGLCEVQLAWLVELSPPADLHSRIIKLFRQMSSVNYQDE